MASKKMVKMTEKDWIKSIYKTGDIKTLTKRDTKPREKYRKSSGKLQCPNCFSVGCDEIGRMRDCFFYCRVCGYEGDVGSFLTNEKRKRYHKKNACSLKAHKWNAIRKSFKGF